MLSIELKDEAQKILDAFDNASVFMDVLYSINSYSSSMENHLFSLGDGNDKQTAAANNIRSILGKIRQVISDINLRDFFASLEGLHNDLTEIKNGPIKNTNQIHDIISSIDSFADKFDKFLTINSPKSSAPLVFHSLSLWSTIDGMRKSIDLFNSNIEEFVIEGEEESELSIKLYRSLTLREFSIKLMAIDIIYSELSELFEVSDSQFPIKIQKIESGSLWLKIIGNSRVVALIDDCIRSTAGYLYRNFSTEGKISAVPRQVEAIESMLQLREKLISCGINTEDMDEHIAKSSVKISKNLSSLISGEPEIVVNNEKISVGDEIQKGLIEDNSSLRIGYDEDEDAGDENK